jgi:hypothetical protein
MGVSGQHHTPVALKPGERTPSTHWIGGRVGPRAGLDAWARRKILCPCWGLNPGRPTRSQTLYCLSCSGSQSAYKISNKRVPDLILIAATNIINKK